MFRSPYYSRHISVLAGAFYVGTFVSNTLRPHWGWLSDTWGRRPVLLLGVCGCISAEILCIVVHPAMFLAKVDCKLADR